LDTLDTINPKNTIGATVTEDRDEQGYTPQPQDQSQGKDKDTYRRTPNTKTSNTQISIQLARFQERLENLISTNTEVHQQLLKKQDELCIHVNHEMEAMDARLKEIELHGTTPLREVTEKLIVLVDKIETRVSILEKADLTETAKYKGRMELFKWISIALTIILGVTGILHFFHLM
jgi:hypothetical protein